VGVIVRYARQALSRPTWSDGPGAALCASPSGRHRTKSARRVYTTYQTSNEKQRNEKYKQRKIKQRKYKLTLKKQRKYKNKDIASLFL